MDRFLLLLGLLDPEDERGAALLNIHTSLSVDMVLTSQKA